MTWYVVGKKWPASEQEQHLLMISEAILIYANRFAQSTQKALSDRLSHLLKSAVPPVVPLKFFLVDDKKMVIEPGTIELEREEPLSVNSQEIIGWDERIQAQVITVQLNITKLASSPDFIEAHGLIEIESGWMTFWIDCARSSGVLNKTEEMATLGARQYLCRFR